MFHALLIAGQGSGGRKVMREIKHIGKEIGIKMRSRLNVAITQNKMQNRYPKCWYYRELSGHLRQGAFD